MKRILVVVFLALIVSACSAEGDEFSVHMRSTDIGKQSIKGEITEIDYDHDWFTLGNVHQIHDNCDCHGTWNGHKKYGTVLDHDGEEIQLDDLEVGQCLHLTGRIRADQEGKYYYDRPVYDTAQREPCG